MTAPRSTGMPGVDAQHDFLRARRRATMARLAARLRGEPDDVGVILPYEEVIEALGFVSERSLGLRVVPLDAIVGHGRSRARLRPALPSDLGPSAQSLGADRDGDAPGRRDAARVDLIQIGEIYFVRDGHHRVSVARALGRAGHRRLRDRGGHAHRRREDDQARRPPAEEPRAGVLRAGPAARRRPRRDPALRPLGLRPAGGERRGVGLSPARSAASPSTARRPRCSGSRPNTGPWWPCCATPT